jgi:hypothetical protein
VFCAVVSESKSVWCARRDVDRLRYNIRNVFELIAEYKFARRVGLSGASAADIDALMTSARVAMHDVQVRRWSQHVFVCNLSQIVLLFAHVGRLLLAASSYAKMRRFRQTRFDVTSFVLGLTHVNFSRFDCRV